MLRKRLRRYLPPAHELHEHWLFGRLGPHCRNPGLWHLNRQSVSNAAGIGLFVAFLPVPFQFVIAGLSAIWLRANLPLSIGLIFITNPLTMGPAYYASYLIGAWALDTPAITTGENFQPTIEWLFSQLSRIWQPLVVGCLLVGSLAGAVSYSLVQLGWRAYIVYKRGPLLKMISRR